MKSHPCQYPGCNKSFTRADHLRRHAFNHEQPKNGYTCERCSLHFHRPDLLRRHMTRHAKRDEEAGGPGLGVLETRKRTRRADDGSIVTRPIKRRTTRMSRETAHFPIGDPVTPDGSASDQPSQTGPLLAPMMPGRFEPYVEPVPGQFGADGSLRPLELDTATDFNMPLPFAATHDYNWLCDVAALRDAFNQLELELPLAPDGMTFAGLHTSGLDLVDVDERLLGQDALSVLQGGKYETRGLGVATAQQLAVRWGMVQDAMKVLVGLV